MDRRKLNVVDFVDFIYTESVFAYRMEEINPGSALTALKIEKGISKH